ncbi:MAG: lycopene cyclase domain-containing protein, partial [Bacteroidota bacterium]
EWLFFLVIPFSCMFIYEVMNYFVKKDVLAKQSKHITNLLAITLLLVSMVYNQRLHTFITFLSLSIFLFIHQYILRSTYLGRYYIAWSVCLLPFLIVNGILTAMPILIYNEAEITGLRIFTIPVEDVFYGMLLYLLVLTIYEWLKNSSYAKTSGNKEKI